MSKKRQRLVDSIYEVHEASALLRKQLRGYENAMLKIAKRLEKGEAAIAASGGTDIPAQRRQVTESIEEFEAARGGCVDQRDRSSARGVTPTGLSSGGPSGHRPALGQVLTLKFR